MMGGNRAAGGCRGPFISRMRQISHFRPFVWFLMSSALVIGNLNWQYLPFQMHVTIVLYRLHNNACMRPNTTRRSTLTLNAGGPGGAQGGLANVHARLY